jgi:hypothetical protein
MRIQRLSSALVLAFCFIGASPLAAQSNQAVDRLLDEKQATIADAGYIILAASNIVTEDASPEQVMAALADGKLLAPGRTAEQPITLGEVCYLVMKTTGMQGGLFYSLFPGPRYAAREMAFLHIAAEGNTHPGRTVSGQEVMHILGAALDRKAGRT